MNLKLKKWVYYCVILLSSITTQKMYATKNTSPLNTVVHLLWTNPDGTSGDCYNQTGGGAPSVCSTTICLGEKICFSYAISFSGGSCNYIDYNCNHDILYFSDGTNITVENINYTGPNPTGCVYYTPSSTGTITTTGVNGLSFTIYVLPATPPSLSANITPSVNVCANSQICAQSLTSPIISYNFSSSASSGCINSTSCGTPSTTAFCLPAGNNQIVYTVNAGHTCSNTAVYNVSVVPTTMSISPNGSCSSLTQTFVASFNCNITNPILTYVWTVNPGTSTYTTNTIVYTFPSAGTYTLDCAAYDVNGFVYTAHNIVSIGLMPSVTVTSNANTICNSVTNFTANPNPSGSYTYSWTVKDAVTNTIIPMPAGSTATNTAFPSINFTNIYQNVNIFVTVTNSLGCTATNSLFMPSCCSTPTYVVKHTNKTFTVNTTVSTASVSFGGTITVNNNTTLTLIQTNAQLDPNTKFVLNGNAKVRFINSYVHGCNYMWDGIYPIATGTVDILNSIVEDAKRVAIDSLGAATILFTNSYINKNNVGIALIANKTSTSTVTVKNVLFTCSNVNIPVGANKTPAVQANLTNAATLGAFTSTVMLPPYNTQKSLCGIYLNAASHTGKTNSVITIGGATNEENVFDKMQHGIFSYDSKSNIQNNVFQNFKSTIAPSSFNSNAGILLWGALFGAGNGSYMSVGGSVALKNTFISNDFGINNLSKSGLLATYNTFSVQTTGVYITANNNGSAVGINFNNFYQNGIAVNFYNNTYLTGSIKNNNMNNTAASVGTYADNFAIRCTEATLATNSSYPAFDIDNNNISGYYNGIYAVNTLSLIATDNEVHMRQDNANDHWQSGICITGSNANKVINNMIDMPSLNQWAYWQSGIFMALNQVPRVQCNSINNLAMSITFKQNNSTVATDGVKSNYMQNAKFGIWMHDNAVIGNQAGNTGSNSSDNVWNIPNLGTDTTYYTYMQGSSNPGNHFFYTRALGSGFDIPSWKAKKDATANCNRMAGNNSSAAATGTACIANTATPSNLKVAGNALASIMQGADDILTDFDNEQNNGLSMADASANAADNSVDNTMSLKAMNRRHLLYNLVLQNINVQQDASLSGFMNSIKSNNTGLLLAVDSLIHQAEKKSSIINNAKQANTAIVPNNLVEQSQQEFNNLYLEYLAQNKKLNPAQLSSMISIAEQCPSYYGISVYQARTVLFDINKQSYRNACENVSPSKSTKRMSQTIDNEEQLTSVNVFPNPANNQLFVNANDYAQVSIKLYNIMGVLVADKIVVNNNSLDISNFANGVYTYKVYNNDTELKVGKLIITH